MRTGVRERWRAFDLFTFSDAGLKPTLSLTIQLVRFKGINACRSLTHVMKCAHFSVLCYVVSLLELVLFATDEI